VGVLGVPVAQCPLQLELPCRTVDQVGTADHIADVLLGIIDHHRELIGEYAITAADHDIAQWVKAKSAYSLQTISEFNRFTIPDAESGGGGAWLARAGTAGTGVAAIPLGRQAAARTAAFIGPAAGPQLLQAGLVEKQAGGLVADLPVPEQVQGLKGAQNIAGAAGDDTGGVEVFNPYQPAAAMMAGIDEAADRGQNRTGMQPAGRRGGKAAGIGIQR
jgi:hypothetical protein